MGLLSDEGRGSPYDLGRAEGGKKKASLGGQEAEKGGEVTLSRYNIMELPEGS